MYCEFSRAPLSWLRYNSSCGASISAESTDHAKRTTIIPRLVCVMRVKRKPPRGEARSSKKAKALVVHGFDSNFLLEKFATTDGAHVPFAGGELPAKAGGGRRFATGRIRRGELDDAFAKKLR